MFGRAKPYLPPLADTREITHYRQYKYFSDDINENYAPYLDLFGMKFIPCLINDKSYSIAVDDATETANGLIDGDEASEYVLAKIKPLKVQSYYIDEIPVVLRNVIELHCVKYTCCVLGGRRYHVHPDYITKLPLGPQETIEIDTRRINLFDFYTDDTYAPIKFYLQLLDVRIVRVQHSGCIYYIPVENLSNVARRLGLFTTGKQ